MACNCSAGAESGKTGISGIPIKLGEPLSTACERANTIGSIPQILRYPGFILVGGASISYVTPDAGINNPSLFFKSRSGCYQSDAGRLSGTTCA